MDKPERLGYYRSARMKVCDVLRLLCEDGWFQVGCRGDHRQFEHPVKPTKARVAGKPNDDVRIGTLKAIFDQAGWQWSTRDRRFGMQARANAKDQRIAELEGVVAQACQLADTVGAPVRVLDLLWAAANGRPLPAETFLPVVAEECEEVARRQRVIDQLRDVLGTSAAQDLGRLGGKQRSVAKARAARANGRKGGRPKGSQVRSAT